MPQLHIVKPKKKRSAPRKAKAKSRTKSGSDDVKQLLKKTRSVKRGARKDGALRRLGVTADQVAALPDITSMLKEARGGLAGVLQAMRFSQNACVVEFLEKYDSVPERDRKSVSWEAIALAANVDLSALLGGTILAIQAQSANMVKVIALSHHPEIMRSQVKFAKAAGGEKDRTQINTILGALPTAKGSTFIINPVQKGIASGEEDEAVEEVNDDLDHLFPSLSTTQETLVPARSRMLEAGN